MTVTMDTRPLSASFDGNFETGAPGTNRSNDSSNIFRGKLDNDTFRHEKNCNERIYKKEFFSVQRTECDMNIEY